MGLGDHRYSHRQLLHVRSDLCSHDRLAGRPLRLPLDAIRRRHHVPDQHVSAGTGDRGLALLHLLWRVAVADPVPCHGSPDVGRQWVVPPPPRGGRGYPLGRGWDRHRHHGTAHGRLHRGAGLAEHLHAHRCCRWRNHAGHGPLHAQQTGRPGYTALRRQGYRPAGGLEGQDCGPAASEGLQSAHPPHQAVLEPAVDPRPGLRRTRHGFDLRDSYGLRARGILVPGSGGDHPDHHLLGQRLQPCRDPDHGRDVRHSENDGRQSEHPGRHRFHAFLVPGSLGVLHVRRGVRHRVRRGVDRLSGHQPPVLR